MAGERGRERERERGREREMVNKDGTEGGQPGRQGLVLF